MDRRAFITGVGGSILAAPLAVDGQQTGKVYRIGYLTVPSRETAQGVANSFQLGLRDLGWIQGQNVVVDYRFAESNVDRLPDLAAELVRLKADVIVAGANAAVTAAKDATGTIPIVMFLAVDPVGSGLVASLARPGGNVTGLTSTAGSEIFGKQLQILKSAFPRVSRVGVLVNDASPLYARLRREIEVATQELGLQRQMVVVRGAADFEGAFAKLIAARVDAVFVSADSMFYQHRVRLVKLVAKTRLPAMWGLREYAQAGGLMAYSTDLDELARRAAIFVDKILKGAKPADLPVEQPTKFELIVNLKTAKALGLTIPQTLLFQANQVIE
jgi:ABC-type uncharacterized transport system substrate-binding protein